MKEEKRYNNDKENKDKELDQKEAYPQEEKQIGEEISLKKEEYEKMVAQIQDLKDKWLRTAAEFENAKKRWQKEKEDILIFGNSQLISALLPVLDHFDKAMERLGNEKNEFEQGVELIHRELNNTLNKFGLQKIADLKGKDFDPFEQEAISYEEDDEIPEGKVIEVMRPGYKFQNRLLRPAMVKVSKGKKVSDEQKSDQSQGGDKNG
jgi:molecular chaperone GrpE